MSKVFCKYLWVPLNEVYGVAYGEGEKRRVVGPFFSLGAAVRYYDDELKAGKLKPAKYAQYLYNVCDQMAFFDSPWGTKVSTEVDSTTGALVNLSKAKVVANYQKVREALEELLPPLVSTLETHGGTHTLTSYAAADRTLTTPAKPISVEEYLLHKEQEQLRRKKNRVQGKPKEFSLYAIGFAKNRTDLEEVNRIDVNNKYFQNFIQCKKTLSIRTQRFKNGGIRFIFSAGQNINHRATRLLYPGISKEEKETLKVKGFCFVLTTPNADLKLQGFLPVNENWVPVLDKADNELTDNLNPSSTTSSTVVDDLSQKVIAYDSDSDSDDDSDSDSDSDDEEFTDLAPPQVVPSQNSVTPPVITQQTPPPSSSLKDSIVAPPVKRRIANEPGPQGPVHKQDTKRLKTKVV